MKDGLELRPGLRQLQPARPSWRESRPANPSWRESVSTVAVVAVPAAIAVALCLYELSGRNLWLDEAASVSIASQHGGALGAALAHDGGNMLGYYALLHVLVGLFGTGAAVIRLPSVLGAGLAAALLSLLAVRLFGRRTGFLAGILTAVSLTMIYWGQNARAYALMIGLACGSYLALVQLLESRRRAWRPWVAYVALTTASVYCGLAALLILPAQLAILAWHRKRVPVVLSAMVVTAACCAPLAVLALNRGTGQLFWVPQPSFKSLKHVVQSLSSSGLEPGFYTDSGRFLLFLTLALTLAAAIRVGYPWRRRAEAWRPTLALAWLIIPIALSVIVSEIGQSIFEPRYLLVCLPAVALLLAWLLDGIWRSDMLRPLPATAVALGLLVALVSLRALQVAPSYAKSSEPWRAATRYVIDRARPGDCLAFYPLDVRMPFRYYLGGGAGAPAAVLPRLPWSRVRPDVEQYVVPPESQLLSDVGHCGRVWLVSSHAGEADGPPASQANYQRYFVLLARLERRYPTMSAASFGHAGIITVSLLSA